MQCYEVFRSLNVKIECLILTIMFQLTKFNIKGIDFSVTPHKLKYLIIYMSCAIVYVRW